MTNPEEIEKMRQAIMRYRELLDLLQIRMNAANADYERLFAHLSPEERAKKPEKDLQGLAALEVLNDRDAFQRAVMRMQFAARDFEREFEQVYHNTLPEDEPSDL
ncbi:MAG: hypothetical protein K8I30_23525 [Anaerolineae bacterium]|nr:hypothetical protein [Anaerolineae bacterium]